MRQVRIADEALIGAPLEAAWQAIEDPATHAQWHPFVTKIAGGHELDQVRTCNGVGRS